MEERMATNKRKIFRAEIELQITNTILEKIESEGNTEGPNLVDQIEVFFFFFFAVWMNLVSN